jgi:chromosome segregation ATPase
VEIVGLYEAQREALESELSAARAETKVLMSQLREAQNGLVAKDRAYAAALATAAAGQEESAALARERLRCASLQRELSSVQAEAAEALRGVHRKLGEAEAALSNMRGEAESLAAELSSRPTIQEVKQLRREIDLMQRKLSSLRYKAANGGGDGWAAEAGEEELALVKVNGQRGRRSTQAAIDRDKALARLGLWRVEEYPREVLVDLVQVGVYVGGGEEMKHSCSIQWD